MRTITFLYHLHRRDHAILDHQHEPGRFRYLFSSQHRVQASQVVSEPVMQPYGDVVTRAIDITKPVLK